MSGNTKGISTAPSAAHLCRLVGKTPEETAKLIIEFQNRIIKVKTWPAVGFLQKRLGGAETEFLTEQADHHPNIYVAKAAKETLPLIDEYIEQHPYNWFRPLKPTKLVLTPKLETRLKPIGLLGNDEEALLVTGQVWKDIALNTHQFRLWATMLKVGLLDNNPDIEGFHWLEMSAPRKGGKRELNIRTIEAVGFYSDEEFSEYVKNIEAAMVIVNRAKKQSRPRKSDPNQGSFLDPDELLSRRLNSLMSPLGD